jgi:hypothetical protein
MTRIEIYLVGVVALVLAALAAGFYERHVGYEQAKSEAAVALAAADARAADISNQLAAAAHKSDQALEDLRTQHAKDLTDALSGVKPVIVRSCPTAGVKLPPAAAAVASPDDTSSGPAHLPVPAERDIGSALVMLAGECQAERDRLVGWQMRQQELTATGAH